MKRQLLAILFAMVMISITSSAWEKDKDVQALKEEYHYIKISGANVFENIKFYNILNKEYDGVIKFWICSHQCSIEINGIKYIKNSNDNIVQFNLSEYGYAIGAKDEMNINVSYKFSGKFEKEIIYPVDEMRIEVYGNEFARGNIPLEFSNGVYTAEFKPLKGDSIWIEFTEEKEESGYSTDNLIFGFTAIFAGLVLLLFVMIKRR
ncbi:MAG: hypothetical protein J7K61_03400 [Thermoplasmata archaeon]|nr:hypothetical protein [Thermoplasmata archaeon]